MGKHMKKYLRIFLPICLATILVFTSILGFIYWPRSGDKDDDGFEFSVPTTVIGPHGIPTFISGRFTERTILNWNNVFDALGDVSETMKITDAREEFTQVSSTTFGNVTAYRLQQVYKNIPVFGNQLTVLARQNGRAQALSGYYAPNIDTAVEPLLEIAQIGHLITGTLGPHEIHSHELNIFVHTDGAELVYVLIVEGIDFEKLLVIGAQTGTTYETEDLVSDISAQTQATQSFITALMQSSNSGTFTHTDEGICGETFTITLEEYAPGRFRFVDPVRDISIRHSNSSSTPRGNSPFISGSIVNGQLVPDDEFLFRKAISTMGNAIIVQDFYQAISTPSVANAIPSNMNIILAPNYRNASVYSRSGNISIGALVGDLPGSPIATLQTVDVLAHEFQHIVNSRLANMATGPLNEAFADIFGILAYSFRNDWTMGSTSSPLHFEDGTLGTVADILERNHSNPSLGERPAQRFDEFYRDDWRTMTSRTGNIGSPHFNSTVFGHAAYLMWSSGAFADRYEMGRVFLGALLLLDRNATYQDAAMAILEIARAQGLSSESLGIIEQAFLETNIVMPASIRSTGIVQEAGTLAPIEDAQIYIYRVTDPISIFGQQVIQLGPSRTTNADGEFNINMNFNQSWSGRIRIMVLKEGFVTHIQTMPIGAVPIHDFTITLQKIPADMTLDEMRADRDRIWQMFRDYEYSAGAYRWNHHGGPWIQLNAGTVNTPWGGTFGLIQGAIIWIQPSMAASIDDEWVRSLPHPWVGTSSWDWFIDGPRLVFGNGPALAAYRDVVGVS